MTVRGHRGAARTAGWSVLALLALLSACSDPDRAEAPDVSVQAGQQSAPLGSETTSSVPRRTQRGAGVARPTVAGPHEGGSRGVAFNALPAGMAEEYGYLEEEYLIAGEARAYAAVGEWGPDGAWEVTEGSTAPYVTRIIVRRPTDPADFDGTAIVEWHNVSSGLDANPDFALGGEEALSHGSVWVGVSAQRVGVDGEGPSFTFPGLGALPLQVWDPDRYAALDHPGDEYSYDIFSQAGQALLRPEGVDPLEGLEVDQLIAVGASQSAARLLTYVNAVHPRADLFDGFLLHSRFGSGAVLAADADAQRAPHAWVRTDLDDPVFQFVSETDLFQLSFVDARQPDTDRIRTWEVAGAAHLDQAVMAATLASTRRWDPTAELDVSGMCGYPVNDGPAGPVLRKALADLRIWVAEGIPPVSAAPLETTETAIVRDDDGIARGGVRTPAVDAPLAVHSGEGRTDSGYLCSLFGTTERFGDTALLDRYPTAEDYMSAVRVAAAEAVEAGHLRDEDAARMVEEARGAQLTAG